MVKETGVSNMADFKFIENDMLKQLAERFWYEATVAKQNQLWFSTGALSGATVEVVLIAIFEMLGDQPSNLDSLTLGGLIKRIQDIHEGNIPDHILSMAIATKDCRNLFHPGRARSVGLVEKEEAEATYTAVELILKWVNQYASQRFRIHADIAAQVIVRDENIDMDKVLAYKKQMSISQWFKLPDAIKYRYEMIDSSPVIGGSYSYTPRPAKEIIQSIVSKLRESNSL